MIAQPTSRKFLKKHYRRKTQTDNDKKGQYDVVRRGRRRGRCVEEYTNTPADTPRPDTAHQPPTHQPAGKQSNKKIPMP